MALSEATASEALARADELARQLKERGHTVYEDVRERGMSAVEAARSKIAKKTDSGEAAGI